MTSDRSKDSYSLSWTENKLKICDPTENTTRLLIADLVAIGEYTNEDGPFLDDWFAVFVLKNGNSYEIPLNKAEWKQLEVFFRDVLHAPFAITLCFKTTFASSIIWPESFQGKELFTFTIAPEPNFLKRFLRRISGLHEISIRYGPCVEALMNELKEPRRT